MNKRSCDICETCIETYSSSCVQMGIEIQELGIECGDSLDSALLKVAGLETIEGECTNEYVRAAESQTQPVQASDIMARAGTILSDGSSICASQLSSRNFSYSVENTSDSSILKYDLSYIKTIPGSFNHISTTVTLAGGEGVIGSSKSSADSFVIRPNQFPASVRIRSRFNSSCGQIELQKNINIQSNSSKGNFNGTMDLNDLTLSQENSDLNQEQYNQLLENEISRLKSRLETVETGDLSVSVGTLQGQVSSLESSFNSVSDMEFVVATSAGGTTTKTLSELLQELTQTVYNLQGEVAVLRNDYNVLKNRVDNLPSTITLST